MAIPRSPDPTASYWGVDPTLPPTEEPEGVPPYWGGDSYAPTGDQQVAEWAAKAGISAPAAPPPEAPKPPVDPVAGWAAAAGISAPKERVYNDFLPTDGGAAGVKVAPPAPTKPAAAPAAPMGPTAADDAAFAAYKAKLAAPKPSGGGKGALANPDPYGIGAAQKAQIAALDARMGAMGRAATAEQDRGVLVAEHQANLARMQEEDAAIARSEQDYAGKLFNEQMTEIGRQIDDVKARKVDPLKDFKEAPALGVLAVVGGAVGGFYQGISGGQRNQFLDELDHHIERGIAEQERQIRDEKFALGEGINMLHQQRQAQKDDSLAHAQMRNLAYEAVKNEIAAEADRVGTDIAKANADAAIADIAGRQGALQEQIARQKQSVALAAANQAHARQREVQETYKATYDKALSAGLSPAVAEYEARRLVGVVYGPPGAVGERVAMPDEFGGMTREQRGKVTMERQEAQHVSDSFNAQIDAMKKHPALDNLGVDTGALSHLGQRVAPGSSKTVQDLNELNTAIINAIGKVAKDAEGKPNVLMMERYEHRFSIEPTDTKEIALQKLEGARNVVNRLAQQQGAATPRPAGEIAAELGAKPVGR